MKTFSDAGFDQRIIDVLSARKIETPTPIQSQAITPAMNGGDVIGIAQTGTGKTLAFLLPLMHQLLAKPGKRALILAPTRELAMQIQESCAWFQKSLKIYSTVVVGGMPMGKQIQALKRKPEIIIATPGRLIDHLERKTASMHGMEFLIFDEADRMFDMGFAPQIRQVLSYMPKADQRQTLIFSATMPDAVANLIEEHMKEPVRIEIAVQGTTSENVSQEIVVIDNAHRKEALIGLLKEEKGGVIVFTRTKYQAKGLNQYLRKQGFRAEELHGNRSQPQRKRAIAALQSKKSRILVATDVAARGIDIPHVNLVVNFELPDNPEDYVHRIGRTGRAGREGRAVSFVLTDQHFELRQVQKLIDVELEETQLPNIPAAQIKLGSSRKKRGGGRGRGRGGYGGGRRSGGGRSGGGRGNGGRGKGRNSGRGKGRNSSRGGGRKGGGNRNRKK